MGGIVLVARVLVPLALVAGAGALRVETVTLQGGAKDCKYRVTFPRTYQPRIDAELAAWAKLYASCDPGKAVPADQALTAPVATTTSPTVVRNDARIFAVSFEETIESEEVHDTHERTTFNFLRPDGWRVYLPEIFDAAALKKISQLAVEVLRRQLGGGSDSDQDVIARGAGPVWNNFETFVLKDKTLDLYFASERVGSYADGPQEIELPLAELAPYLRKDWRVPAPSFDCVKARTVVERAICSDVALARLDRELHERYLMSLGVAERAKKEALRQTQRSWLQRRDAGCADPTSARLVTCLDDLYQERLKSLGAR